MKIKSFYKMTALFLACILFLEMPVISAASAGYTVQGESAEGEYEGEPGLMDGAPSPGQELPAEQEPSTDQELPEEEESFKEQEPSAGEETPEDPELPKGGEAGESKEPEASDGADKKDETFDSQPKEPEQKSEGMQENGASEETVPDIEEPAAETVQGMVLEFCCVERTEEGIRLSFPLMEGIDSYEIYREEGSVTAQPEGTKDEEKTPIAVLEHPQLEEGQEQYEYFDKEALAPCPYTYVLYGYALSGETKLLAGESEPLTVEYVQEPVQPPAQPTSPDVESGEPRSLRIYWKASSDASGYEVWRSRMADGEYVLVKNVEKVVAGEEISITDTDLALGAEYFYKIRAYLKTAGSDGETQETILYSEYSSPSQGTAELGRAKEFTAQATRYSTIQLNWDKLPEAKGYEIYYSTSASGEYKLLKSLTRNSYKYTKAMCGVTYYFKIRAYVKSGNTMIYGGMSDAVSGKTTLAAPAPYVYKTSYNSVTLKWKKVAGATNYRIYVSDSENGSFRELATVRRGSYSHKKLETGKTLYYKVEPVRKEYTGDSSEVIAATPEFEPLSGLRASAVNTEGIKLSWRRVAGIKTYVVERYSNESDAIAGRNCKYSTEVNKASYKDTGLSENTIYYYLVYGKAENGYTTEKAGPVKATTKKASTRKGIDVSEYQGRIDWNAAAGDGVSFAMLRILVRNGNKDAQFENNYKNARAAGVKVGVYRYSYAQSVSEIQKEAREVVDALDGRRLNYPVALDMEDSSQANIAPGTKAKMIRAYKKIIEDAGYEFVLYANTNWLNGKIDMSQLSDVDLWVARWSSSGHGYTGPGKVTMWQYTSKGTVKGINGNVDMDISYKNY